MRLALPVAAMAACLLCLVPRAQAQSAAAASAAARREASAAPSAVSFVHEGLIDAPAEAVWNVWTTAEGYKRLGPALVDIDLRIGGLIRSKYQNTGTLGDADTIVNRILAFEPGRMIAICIDRPPAGFPFREAWKHTWTVVTITPVSSSQAHLRIASLGFASDEESLKMRQFFEAGNAATLKLLTESFRR